MHGNKPHRFRALIPNGDCVFNQTLGMDSMKIGNKTVLHIVDRDTKFSAAVFKHRESTEKMWKTFVHKWVAAYVGYPDTFILDQGSQFQSAEFASLLIAAGIIRQDAEIESPNSLGEVERYHAHLGNIFEKVHREHPYMDDEVVLQLSTTSCNELMAR